MKKILLGALLALTLSACAITKDIFGPTPEAQIVNGANAVKAGATLSTALLKNDKITVAQAKGYSTILHTANDHLHVAANALSACRKATGSTTATRPDPCAPTVAGDIGLAVSVIVEVQKVLSAK